MKTLEGIGNGSLEGEQGADPTIGITQLIENLSDVIQTNGGSLAGKIATTLLTPVASRLTQQQQDILLAAKEVEDARGNGQRVLVIGAGAGTGKTFTLKQLEQVLTGNGQYTAFNKSIVEDSRAKFKKVACNTTHSLAFRAVGCRFKHRMNGAMVRSWEIAGRLGIEDFCVELPAAIQPPESDGRPAVRRLNAAFLAGQVTGAIERFCQSADTEISVKHFHSIGGIDEVGRYENSNRVKDYLLPFAQIAWADLSDPSGSVMPFNHDIYVKIWEMNQPVISANYILLDEAQDTAPVMLSILQQQKHSLLILVGDDCQQIYEWRGACNAMKAFQSAPRKLLSQSFRFGQAVADVANAVLSTLEEPTDLVMRGLPSILTRVCEVREPRCYLYRTNAGAISRLMLAMDEGKRGHLIGGTKEVVSFCRAALELQRGKSTSHPELGCFSKWSEVQECSKEDEGADLRLMVKLIDEFRAERIIAALDDMPREDQADLIISTAHRSKGREWASVKLGQDFPTANNLTDADRRLVYVAVTRAQEELDISQCPTFCGGYDKKSVGEDGDKGSAGWIPGIKIEYTSPMPTREELSEYRAAKSTQKVPQESGKSESGAQSVPAPESSPGAKSGTGNGIPADLNTWAKGRNGLWAVRGKVGQRGEVTVTRKNGTTSRETIKRVIWHDSEVALYEV